MSTSAMLYWLELLNQSLTCCSMLWMLPHVLSVTQESLTTASLKSCMMTHTGSVWQIESDKNWVSSCTDVSMARLTVPCWLLHTSHWCCRQATSQVSHTSTDGGAMTPALYCWLPSIRCAGSDSLELFAWWPSCTAGLCVLQTGLENWLFSSY